MTTKIVRGQLMTFIATPKDYLGNAVTPDSVTLYANYPHGDGTVSTDTITMAAQSDGTYLADFDTGSAESGTLQCSFRSVNPAAAEDLKFTLTANAANPDPT